MCKDIEKIKSNSFMVASFSVESTIMLRERESSQGESSVLRLRLEGRKKPIRGCKKNI